MSLRNCESLSLKGFGNPPLYYFEIQDLKNPSALEPRAMKEKLAKKIICDTRLVFCLLERTNFWFKTDRERGALVTITTTQHNAKCNRNVSALSKQQLLSYLFFVNWHLIQRKKLIQFRFIYVCSLHEFMS